MVKSESKVYKVVVGDKDAKALLVCVTYKIGTIGQGYGAEFYELMTSFDNSDFRIPIGSHEFSFKEELRILSTAALVAPEGRKNIETWITEKMKVAYGENSTIEVSEFQN